MYHLKRASNSEYYFTLVIPGNSAVIMTSETYKYKQGALGGIRAAVKANVIAQQKDFDYVDATGEKKVNKSFK